ncbi:MAG: serine--tRNA ligase [Bacteroidota bacterium]|nr:serine--tRNA ligase [Bacteroidota bacterium]
MLSLQYIRENREEVIERLKKRNHQGVETIDSIIAIDAKRRESQKKLDDILSQSKLISKEVGALMQQGKTTEAEELKNQSTALKGETSSLQTELADLEAEQTQLLYKLPNLPHQSVPEGKTPDDNEVVSNWGDIVDMDDASLPHWEIAKKYNIIDLELGVKITGAGFPIYKGKGARLQRALINYFLDEATAQGYLEIEPPILVNEETCYATGQLPDKDGQMYYVTEDKLYLIPTAEVPLTNIYRDVIVAEKDFPIKMTGFTPCFRREAGSYGKDVRGLNRLHQFDKVEIVCIEHPERSYHTLEVMKDYVAGLLQNLGLSHRILKLCAGDMGWTSALTYDLEVWSAAQRRWLEVSSVSNFETYQANRLKLRYKDTTGKTNAAHTLNGSALALPRIVAALLENFQTADGVVIPEVLRKYTGFDLLN